MKCTNKRPFFTLSGIFCAIFVISVTIWAGKTGAAETRFSIENQIQGYLEDIDLLKKLYGSNDELDRKRFYGINERIKLIKDLKEEYLSANGTWKNEWNIDIIDIWKTLSGKNKEKKEVKNFDQSTIITAPETIEFIENYQDKSLVPHYQQFLIDDFESYSKKKDNTRYLKTISPINAYKALYEAIQRVKLNKTDQFKNDKQRSIYFGIDKDKEKLSQSMNVFLSEPATIWRNEIMSNRSDEDNEKFPDGEFLTPDEIKRLIKFERENDQRLSRLEDVNVPITVIPNGNNLSNEMAQEITSFKDKFTDMKNYKHVFIIGKGTGKNTSWFSLVILPGEYIVSGERANGDAYEEVISKILAMLGLSKKEFEENKNEKEE